MPVSATPAAVVLGLLTVASAVAGALPFAVVVVVLAAVLLVDFTAVLSSAGPRPVTIAAALPGVALPAAVAARPATGWTTVPDVVAVGVLLAFVVVLAFGRRRDVTEALGATALAGLVVGLGASGLLLLRSLPDGTAWVLGVVLVVAAVEAARQAATVRVRPAQAAAGTIGVALLGGGVLAVAVDPPFSWTSAAGVAAVALLAAAAASLLHEAVDDAVASTFVDRAGRPGRTVGALSTAAMPVLLAAPAAYALARLAAL